MFIASNVVNDSVFLMQRFVQSVVGLPVLNAKLAAAV
jgi:hypothetical protein